MLSRGGGAVAFQKVVSKVSDLPSPLDAEPGMRIIVRETEEVYGLNAETRMWEVIGTIKKVGGLRPEELKAHVESAENPHKTSLQDVLSAGSEAEITQAIVVKGKAAGSDLRLLDRGALRYGPAAGDSKGLLWLNAGSAERTFLRVVDAEGQDLLVAGRDGLVSGGSATFYGGFKGRAEFDDEIVAKEGVEGAEGYDLVLSGDKGVLLKVDGKEKALLDDTGLAVKGGLAVKDLRLRGQVDGDLVPSKEDPQLGADKARWAAFLSGLDVDGQVVLHVGANSKKAPFQVTGPVPGDSAILTASGELGLGTDKPEARLDVRGDALIDGALRLSKDGVSCGDWSTHYGSKLHIDYKGKSVLTGGPEGLTLAGGAKVSGDLAVSGKFATGAVAGLADEEISFHNNVATYRAKDHVFKGALKVSGEVELPGVKTSKGNLQVDGAVYADSAALTGLTVGSMSLTGSRLATPGELELDASVVVAQSLRLLGAPQVEVLNTLKLQGTGGSATFSLGGPNCGVLFEGKHWEILGLNKLDVDSLGAKSLKLDGPASFCGGKASVSDKGLRLAGELSVGGLALKKVEEEVELDGLSAQTKFKLPAGVRVEAVLVRPLSEIKGARFLQAGDDRDAARFLNPSTDLKGGALLRGLAHWDRGQVIQKHESPVVLTADAPAAGKLLVTVHYVDPAAL